MFLHDLVPNFVSLVTSFENEGVCESFSASDEVWLYYVWEIDRLDASYIVEVWRFTMFL